LVLLACILGIELLDRVSPLIAAVPGLLVTAVSQAYIALTAGAAVLVALAYAAAVAALLVNDRPASARRTPYRSLLPWRVVVPAGLVTVIAALGSVMLIVADPADRDPYTLQQLQAANDDRSRLTNPLDELASRLDPKNKDRPLFRYQSPTPVGSWRQVALDSFDGTNWSTSNPFLRLGSELASGADVRVPTTSHTANIQLTGLDGPWLPGQLLPASVTGAGEPQIEPVGGTLLAGERPVSYTLNWSKPTVTARQLLNAGVNDDATGGLGDIGTAPAAVTDLVDKALGGRRPTFQTALGLERYLRDNYKLASGPPLPTGHGWPQLQRFLLQDKVGTSEQFAAAYVAMARLAGIPARLVVGFRAPPSPGPDGWYTVRNGDVLAWPEVAVNGVGWWPLDPAGKADTGQAAALGSEAQVTAEARSELPPPDKLEDPPLPPNDGNARGHGPCGDCWVLPVSALFIGSAALLVLWVVGIPLAKLIRASRRRRRTGTAAVVGAWSEARDRLRSFGIEVTTGMTVRELAQAAAPITAPKARAGLTALAQAVDEALWSGTPTRPDLPTEAWSAVKALTQSLKSRPWPDRLKAQLTPR
jgi:hypothetical protein